MECVSVIVPVFNVEDYMDECVDSILKQSHANLDVVLVNDGSTDSSPQRCNRWAELDRRVRVVHKPNGGLSSARNAGLDEVRGSYVLFVDSDDLVERTLVETLLRVARGTGAQIVRGGFVPFREDPPEFSHGDRSVATSGVDALLDLVRRKEDWSVCASLYERELLGDDLRFWEGMLYEDVDFTPRAMSAAERIAQSSARLYGYRQRAQSIMGLSAAQGDSSDLLTVLQSNINFTRKYVAGSRAACEEVCAEYVHHGLLRLVRGSVATRGARRREFERAFVRFGAENLAWALRSPFLARPTKLLLVIATLWPAAAGPVARTGRRFAKLVRQIRQMRS